MAMYEANRKAYIDSLDYKERDEKVLKDLGRLMDSIIRFVFSDDLRELSRRKRAFHEGGRELIQYVRYLVEMAEKYAIALHDFTDLHSLLNLIELENEIDFEMAEHEIDQLTDDVKKLLGVLQALVEKGNTVITIEHNLDVIKSVDYLVDLGPEGGDEGGYVVAAGTPEEVAKSKKSYTGQFLAKIL